MTERLLKISELAKLADTTRRTLIFYDEVGVFQPVMRNAAGYRYYAYQQLYDLLFILGLRKLGMTVEQVKHLQHQPPEQVTAQLLTIQDDIDNKIAELTRIQQVVAQKVGEQPTEPLPLYQPTIQRQAQRVFWCSPATASCTEEEVAELFSAFYQQLDELALMDTGQSGFLTDLAGADPDGYATAGFRVVKEATMGTRGRAVPRVEKPAGRFVVVKVENTTPGICRGLAALQRFCAAQALTITADLWQLNVGDDPLSEHGGTAYGQLAYRIAES